MKRGIIYSILVLCAIIGAEFALAYDFVPVDQADVLVITHSQLRTPGWQPDQPNAWETELLVQKAGQGYTVAIWSIADEVPATQIRSYIEANQGSFQYVLIIGDARRPRNSTDYPYDVPPLAPAPSDFASGNIIPIWRESIPNRWYWAPFYENIVESDQGYVDNISNAVIGRIPAETRQEIRNYVSKADRYLADPDPSWSRRILEVIDDVFHAYNMCSPLMVRDWTETSELEFPSDWPVTRLATSTASSDSATRIAAFENEFNHNTPGVIHVMGTSGRADDLVNWYFGNSPYNFTNSTHLPLMLAMSCDLGGFDQYTADGSQIPCVPEKLVLLPGGGVIAAVGATGPTIQTMQGLYCMYFWRTIFAEGVRNFGQITKRAIELGRGVLPSEDFVLDMMTLLGDPTLSLPLVRLPEPHEVTIYRAGSDVVLSWADDFSPYHRIYSSANAQGPFTTLEGSTDQNSFVIADWMSAQRRFYTVVGWDGNP